jgi:hypothetical protein
MLRYVGERDDSECVFTPRIIRVEPISRAATPIEDLEGSEGRTKGVSIKSRVEWVDGDGGVEEGMLLLMVMEMGRNRVSV